jgi:hypothetical protein
VKKLFLYIFLFFIWCNISNAGILDQSQYLCKTKDNLARTEINILKKYNEDHFLVSENFGFGEIVAFSRIEKDSINFFMLNDSFGSVSVIEGILGPIKNNKSGSYREYNSNIYGLEKSRWNELMLSNPKFGEEKKNYQTLELSKGELLNEIKIHNNIDRILSSSGRVSIGVGGQYICNIGVDTSKSNNNSKPQVQLIDILKSGCKGDKKDVATIKFCECYGNWFYDNLNDEQFNEFIYLSREEKVKFVQKNNIINQSKVCSMK